MGTLKILQQAGQQRSLMGHCYYFDLDLDNVADVLLKDGAFKTVLVGPFTPNQRANLYQ